MRALLRGLVSILLAAFAASPALAGSIFIQADSISVQFTTVNLGSGVWQYDYTLQGTFSANQGVAIYFPTPDYVSGSINDLVTGGPDWSTLAFQADPTIPAPGEYDMVAAVDDPSLSSTFDLTFDWNGVGTPGAQTFNEYDFTSGAQLLDTGTTTPATANNSVPEGSPLSMAYLSGLVCAALILFRRRIAAQTGKKSRPLCRIV